MFYFTLYSKRVAGSKIVVRRLYGDRDEIRVISFSFTLNVTILSNFTRRAILWANQRQTRISRIVSCHTSRECEWCAYTLIVSRKWIRWIDGWAWKLMLYIHRYIHVGIVQIKVEKIQRWNIPMAMEIRLVTWLLVFVAAWYSLENYYTMNAISVDRASLRDRKICIENWL